MFIVFIADDAAWNDCGPYGNHKIKTPNINLLAEEGVVFNNAFLTTSFLQSEPLQHFNRTLPA